MPAMSEMAAGPVYAPPAAVDTCRAPWVSMRLSPNGVVQACCVNDAYPLGSIGRGSLQSIWWGERAENLRRAMADADFSLGCQGCGDPRAIGLRAQTLAVDYDHFDLPAAITWPQHIEFALSNTCNLQCVQCDGELSSAIRAQRERRPPLVSAYGEAFFDELSAFLPHLRAATFIGGEPFLMRETRRVWDMLLELDDPPEVWVTTNGTVWDDRVERYLHGLKMGVSLSIDGVSPDTIAGIRVGADPHAVLANRDRFLAATRSYGRDFKLNYCVMPQNWREYLPFLLEAERLGVRVYAARVQRPAEHSLFELPASQLAEVVAGLAEQGAERAHELVLNRDVWDGTVAELAAHLDGREVRLEPVAEMDVPVRAPGRSKEDAERQLRQWRDQLGSVGGRPPVHVTIRERHVTEVECPPWAEFLGLESCVGLSQHAMLPAIVERLGTAVTPVAVPGEEDVHGATWVVNLEGRAIEVHAVAVNGTGDCTHVLVGLARP